MATKKKSKAKNKEIVRTIEMRTADAKTWLDALNSGKYKRASGTLIDEDFGYDEDGNETCSVLGHCCLGVLQDVLGKVQKDKDLPTLRWLQDHKIKIKHTEGEKLTQGRNTEVDIPLIPPVNGYNSVAKLNDSGKYSFKSIAKILEKRIKKI